MYHDKKKMAMGGMNMPRVMKKEMPGGGHVEYGMGGKMEMGMGGDMARAIKIYLMKKGGKTFPDLTGDGKVTFADILKGRLKKKSQAYGGRVMNEGGVSTGVNPAAPAATDGSVMRQEMLAQRRAEREMENSGGLGRRALDVSRGVDMDRGISGQLDSGAAYSGPKYRMAELNEISRGVYDKDIDYGRLAASMGNASSKHTAALSNILANQTAMNQQTNVQAYGGKVMEEGGESDPPRADFLMRSPDMDSAIAEEARDLSQAASDRESAFGTSSTDVFMNVGNVPSMPEAEEDDQPRPGSMDPLQRRGPRLIKRGGEKGLVGGMRQDQEEQVEDFDMDFIFDQTPLPRGEGDTRYSRYQKTMGVKDPRTGVYYYVDSARGFKGPKGKKSLSISSLPEDQRARALKAIEDREMKFAGQSDFYRRQRGL